MAKLSARVQAELSAQRETLERMKTAYPLIRVRLSDLRVGDRVLRLRSGTFSTVIAKRAPVTTPSGVLVRYTTRGVDGRDRPFAGREDLFAYVWGV